MLRSTVLLALLGSFLTSACTPLHLRLSAEDQENEILTLPPADTQVPKAVPKIPLDDGADWLQLVSGEWLRGKLVRIRDDKVDFDSDELDDLSLDLADITTIRTAKKHIVVTEADLTLRGKLVLVGKNLWIVGSQTVLLKRDDLLATLASNGENGVDWSGEIKFGATARSGNTTQDDYSAFAKALRETARTRWRTTYNGVLSRADQSETSNNHRLRSVYDVLLSKRLFVTVPSLDVYSDRFQNIDYRATLAAAVGYELVDTDDHSWNLSAGPAYQYTRFETANLAGDTDDGTFAAVALSNYHWDITSDVEFDFDYAITAAIPETHEYNHNFVTTLSVELVGDLTLDVSFVWDRVNRPVADSMGNVPEEDDYRTTIALGWSF